MPPTSPTFPPPPTWETFNPYNKKLILTIDGGGMRGLIPLAMLVYLEKQLKKPAYEIFDFVAGTSTGAIIAAGLTLGYSAEFIMNTVYRDLLPKAFGKRDLRFWLRYAFRFGLRYQYSWKPFVESLGKFEGIDKKLGELYPAPDGKKLPIILMTTKDLRTTNTYYMVSAGEGAGMFEDYPLQGAVTASGAAALFFRPVDGNLVDGGVGAFGNPCLAAATEAFEYISDRRKPPAERLFKPEETILISLGTGHVSVDFNNRQGFGLGVFGWLRYLALGDIIETAVQQSLNTRAIYRHQGLDFRRFNVNLTKEVAQNVLGVELNGLDPAELTLDSAAPLEIALMEKIGEAYARLIDWTLPDQLSWAERDDPNPPVHTLAGQPRPKDANDPSLPKIDWEGEERGGYGDRSSFLSPVFALLMFIFGLIRSPVNLVIIAVLGALPLALLILFGFNGLLLIIGVLALLTLLAALGAFS